MEDYLFVSPDWFNPTFKEVIGFGSFELADDHASQLAEELQQDVQFFVLITIYQPSTSILGVE